MHREWMYKISRADAMSLQESWLFVIIIIAFFILEKVYLRLTSLGNKTWLIIWSIHLNADMNFVESQ